MSMTRSLSPRDAAEKLGISPDTLRRWERDGLIPCERTPGGQRRYREADICALLEREPGDHAPRIPSAVLTARAVHSTTKRPPSTAASQITSWQRRVNEEKADLEVARLRREREALIRVEREEREARDFAAKQQQRLAAARAAEQERRIAFEATQEKRLEELRSYGRACAASAPPEYEARVVRDLLSTVNLDEYPPNLADDLARAQVAAHVEKLLKPWKKREADARSRLESERVAATLVNSGKLYAQIETWAWERRDSERALREVDRALRDEVEADWTDDDVHDLVDDILDEWCEE